MNKNFSVVVNYGCNKHCFFCAFKNHRLKDVHNPINWKYFKWCVDAYEGDKISVSGGGDPLFDMKTNFVTLARLSGICNSLGKKLDIHTNEDLMDNIESIKMLGLNQLVITANTINITRWRELQSLLPYVKIRMVMVYLNQGADWVREWISFYSAAPRLTIRECWGMKTDFKEIKKELVPESSYRIRFLDDADYNYYYMPDNIVYEDYLANHIAPKFLIMENYK